MKVERAARVVVKTVLIFTCSHALNLPADAMSCSHHVASVPSSPHPSSKPRWETHDKFEFALWDGTKKRRILVRSEMEQEANIVLSQRAENPVYILRNIFTQFSNRKNQIHLRGAQPEAGFPVRFDSIMNVYYDWNHEWAKHWRIDISGVRRKFYGRVKKFFSGEVTDLMEELQSQSSPHFQKLFTIKVVDPKSPSPVVARNKIDIEFKGVVPTKENLVTSIGSVFNRLGNRPKKVRLHFIGRTVSSRAALYIYAGEKHIGKVIVDIFGSRPYLGKSDDGQGLKNMVEVELFDLPSESETFREAVRFIEEMKQFLRGQTTSFYKIDHVSSDSMISSQK